MNDIDPELFLCSLLEAGGLRAPVALIQAAARDAGIGPQALQRAKRSLGARSVRVSRGTSGAGSWYWTLETAPTLTDILRDYLRASPSLHEVARATGTERASLIRFRDGRQSIMLDAADSLATYFGITHKHKRTSQNKGNTHG